MLAVRGGRAAPEAPFVIEHREALIDMLCEAAELEHGIMCQYLFAAFSLKDASDEGLTAAQQEVVVRWKAAIMRIAAEEMLHLARVQNLLSAVGAAPHLVRPNLPAPAGHYPAGVRPALLPFGEDALRHFMYLERPEGMDLDDAEGLLDFAHTEESDAELATLADVAVGLMIDVIGPLGRLVTTLPVGPSHPGRTAGPSFELFYESDYLLPHRGAAWTLIGERLQEAVLFCRRIHADADVNASIAAVGAALNRFATQLVLEERTR